MLALNVLMRGVATDRSTRRQGLRSYIDTTAISTSFGENSFKLLGTDG